MKHTAISTMLVLGVFVMGLNSFVREHSDFDITEKDVQLNIPGYFPKPVYDFSNNKITPEEFVLGRKLFYDPIFSSDSTISCSSCHMQKAAFAQAGQTLAQGINKQVGKRNVPSIQNLIWQKRFNVTDDMSHLKKELLSPVIAPIINPAEMNENFDHVVSKLRRNKEYVALFKDVFHDTIIDYDRLFKALGNFTAILISTNSRYDKYMKGEEKLTDHELRGLEVFRQRCEACHKEPLFTDLSLRNIGLKPDTALKDSGLVTITGLTEDYLKFKVPGLRNVALTAPYMHDGRFKTLKEVLDNYNKGNFYTDSYDTEIMKNVGLLNESVQNDIIAFLKTLTDTVFINDRRFADPNAGK